MAYSRPLDYIDVATRLIEMRRIYPELTLQQVSLEFKEFGGKSWVVFTAAAYRTPDDIRPGMGTAWEPVPGATPYTKDSELQNAETAAWGRALVAIGADTKAGIASAEEVQNRQGPHGDDVQKEPSRHVSVKRMLNAQFTDAPSRKEFVTKALGHAPTGSFDSMDLMDVETIEEALRKHIEAQFQSSSETVDPMAQAREFVANQLS